MLTVGTYLADRYEIVSKIGAGGMSDVYKAKDHVLGRFSSGDRKLVDEAIEFAADAVEKIITDGPDAAMNEYNRKRVTE
mgnify:CR=1 FL=1